MRAHHRLMNTIIKSRKAKVSPTPEEMDRVARVFTRAGGSWRGVFEGGIDDILLLKKVIKVAVDNGSFSPSPDWT